jgi:tRNA modification GTPase
MVDHALAVFFKGPHSATGEDMAEFHIHGSRAVQKLLFDAFQHFGGTRPAAPGEFTKRALEYGKMDLVQAEALSDLLKSDTLAQHQQALRNVEGHLSQRVEVWRKTLISCMAHVQAAIDFGEDDVSEVPPDVLQYVEPRLESLLVEMQQSLHAFRAAQTIRDGLSVAIVGAPNAGKSSLLNRLSRRDAAIVSHIAGTTRDVVSVSMEISGLAVNLMDTAGIRETSDPIEAEGVKRAVKAYVLLPPFGVHVVQSLCCFEVTH